MRIILYTIMIATVLTVFGAYVIVSFAKSISNESNMYISEDPREIPGKRVALVLGTSKYVKGRLNLYYKYRLEGVVKLFRSRKLRGVIVSGDNRKKNYDEPTTMRNDLIHMGIPASYIKRDEKGLSTFDSIVRAKEIFGVDDYVVVSQRFQVQRALYIAHKKAHRAIGFAVKDVPESEVKQKMRYREVLARVKAFFDLNILGRESNLSLKREMVAVK